jgi:hypothetical protein
MAVSIPPEVKRFRAGIIHIFILYFLETVVLVSVSAVIMGGKHIVAMFHWAVFLKFFYLELGGLLVLSGLVSCLFAWLWVFGVSREGVYGLSFWGTQLFIKWGDISKIRKRRLVNLVWLRIYSKTEGQVVWLPLFSSRPVQFRAELDSMAPTDHPIFQHLN